MAPAPFVDRDTVVRALRPGQEPTERPFQTLRKKGFASEGWRLTVRSEGRSMGQIRAYSLFNVVAASFARAGSPEKATQWASIAERLESVARWLVPGDVAAHVVRKDEWEGGPHEGLDLLARATQLLLEERLEGTPLRLSACGDGTDDQAAWLNVMSQAHAAGSLRTVFVESSSDTVILLTLPALSVSDSVEEPSRLLADLLGAASSVEQLTDVLSMPGLLSSTLRHDPPKTTVSVPDDFSW